MDNRDDVSLFQSERLFFHYNIIHENISTSDQTMKKITSIFVILGEIDVDPVSAVAFIGDDVRFLGHDFFLYCHSDEGRIQVMVTGPFDSSG